MDEFRFAGLEVLMAAIRNRQMERHGQQREPGIDEESAAPAEMDGDEIAKRPEQRGGEPAKQGDL
jgi:hypothetical protein